MKISFYDAARRCEITSFEGNLSDAPLAGDNIILVSSPEYEKIYGYDNRSGSVDFRSIDYRDNSVTVYLND